MGPHSSHDRYACRFGCGCSASARYAERCLVADTNDPARRSVRAGRRHRYPRPAGREPHQPEARADGRGREPARRRHGDRHRSGGACRAGRQHGADRGQLLRHQSQYEEAQLRPADQLRADLPSHALAEHRRRARRLALPHARRPDRRGPRQARRADDGGQRAGDLPAHRLRDAQARGQGRYRPSCRSRAAARR